MKRRGFLATVLSAIPAAAIAIEKDEQKLECDHCVLVRMNETTAKCAVCEQLLERSIYCAVQITAPPVQDLDLFVAGGQGVPG